jgi:hypothetical protein
MNEFEKSGISQATLARRLGKNPDRICKLLAGPGNWRSTTASDLLFAISGAELKYSVSYPLDDSPRNFTTPEWLNASLQVVNGAFIKIPVLPVQPITTENLPPVITSMPTQVNVNVGKIATP